MLHSNSYESPSSKPASPALQNSFWRSFVRTSLYLVAILAIAVAHYCAWFFLLFAEQDGGRSWAILPCRILSFPVFLLVDAPGFWRWAPESIEMLVVIVNSLIWGIAVTFISRRLLDMRRPT